MIHCVRERESNFVSQIDSSSLIKLLRSSLRSHLIEILIKFANSKLLLNPTPPFSNRGPTTLDYIA